MRKYLCPSLNESKCTQVLLRGVIPMFQTLCCDIHGMTSRVFISVFQLLRYLPRRGRNGRSGYLLA